MRDDQHSFWYLSRQVGGEFAIHQDFPLEPLFVPHWVEIQGDRLVWGNWIFWSPDEKGPQTIDPPEDLLASFAGLASAAPDGIAAFARAFGTLQICEHDLPRSHNPPRPWMPANSTVDYCQPKGWWDRVGADAEETAEDLVLWEPLSAWYRFAGDARAILRIAANLHSGRVGSPVDWKTIFGHRRDPESVPWWEPSVDGDRGRVAYLVNEWLELGDVRPRLDWGTFSHRPGGRPGLVMRGGGLFGALAIQLAHTVSRSEGLYICDGCGAAHTRNKKPDPNRRMFCLECRKANVPQKLAQRDHVERKGGRHGS